MRLIDILSIFVYNEKMIKTRLNCFKDFECLKGECTETCCRGWDISVDGQTYLKYSSLGGYFAEKIVENIKKDRSGYRFKNKNGRCPFLNDNGLCDIQSELGEEYLSVVCFNHPRFFVDFGNDRDISFSFSCPKVCDLLLGYDGELGFVKEDDGKVVLNDTDGGKYLKIKNERDEIFKAVYEYDDVKDFFAKAYSICGARSKVPEKEKLFKTLAKCKIYNADFRNAVTCVVEKADYGGLGLSRGKTKRVIFALFFRYYTEIAYYGSSEKAIDFIYETITCISALSEISGAKNALIYFDKEILHDEKNIKKLRRIKI